MFLAFSKLQATRHISLYFIANVAKAAIPFLVLPIITHYLQPAEYGIISVFTAVLTFAVPFCSMGLTTTIGRNYHLMSLEEHACSTYTALLLMLGFCLLLFLCTLAGALVTESFMSLPIWLVLCIPLMCLLQNIQTFNRIILRHQQRVGLFVLLEVGSTALSRFGGLCALMLISASWISVIAAQYAAHTLFAILGIYLLLKDKRLICSWDSTCAKTLLKKSWPLMPHAIGGVIMTISDRLVLERMLNTDAVGIYSIGATIGAAVLIYSTAFNNFWGPWMHRNLAAATADTLKHAVKYSYLYFLSLLLVVPILIAIGVAYIWFLVDARYHDAIGIVYWIAAATGVYSMTLAINHYLIIAAKTAILPSITAFCTLVNILLTVLLVRENGITGAAQATFIAYSLYFILMFWQCQRIYPMPWLAIFHKAS